VEGFGFPVVMKSLGTAVELRVYRFTGTTITSIATLINILAKETFSPYIKILMALIPLPLQ
jgi:hypothetical protein